MGKRLRKIKLNVVTIAICSLIQVLIAFPTLYEILNNIYVICLTGLNKDESINEINQ